MEHFKQFFEYNYPVYVQFLIQHSALRENIKVESFEMYREIFYSNIDVNIT